MLRGGGRGREATWEESFHGVIYHQREENFHEGAAGFSSIILAG